MVYFKKTETGFQIIFKFRSVVFKITSLDSWIYMALIVQGMKIQIIKNRKCARLGYNPVMDITFKNDVFEDLENRPSVHKG